MKYVSRIEGAAASAKVEPASFKEQLRTPVIVDRSGLNQTLYKDESAESEPAIVEP
jgi:hypothetical protein